MQRGNFDNAERALEDRDAVAFSKAIQDEMTRNPRGARQIAEVSLLRLAHACGDNKSPTNRMLAEAVRVLSTVAEVLSYDMWEKDLTLRALSVAEATCAWTAEGEAFEKVKAVRKAIETMPNSTAFGTAVRAGIIDQNGRRTCAAFRPTFDCTF